MEELLGPALTALGGAGDLGSLAGDFAAERAFQTALTHMQIQQQMFLSAQHAAGDAGKQLRA
jgi:hypothetical protein